jgi:hypothetical protein
MAMRRRIACLQARALAAAAVVLGACGAVALLAPGVAAGSAGAGRSARGLTLYSVATQEQFLNHADDRQRGTGNNPFGNFKAPTATTREHNKGPFPGDQALFQFKVFSGPDLKKLAGTAVFTCNYNFNRHGFCDATYELTGGTLVGAGALDFNAKNFSLVITGGTGKFRALTGNLVASPAARGAQRLVIALS